MTSPSPLISSMSLLPALSVVLGMPLCTSNCGNDVFSIPKLLEAGSNDYGDDDRLNDVNHRGHDHNSGNHSQYIKRHHKQNRTQPSESQGKGHQSQQEKFAKRAKDNVSRIYARRMMIKAQLERSHPWRNYSGDAAADGTSAGVSSAPAVRKAASGSETHSAQTTRTDKNFVKNENGWQDDLKRTLLSETLLSLLKLKERYEKCTEFYDGSKQSHKKGDNVDFLSPFGISFDHFKHYHHNHRNFHFNFNPVALCESSKQRTLNEYNALSSSSSSSMDELKPAEWNKDIDLAQRRLEFGEKISPLSNTTRLERWTMAVKRMVTLGALAAPIGVMVPGIWVLGGLAGDYDYDENADDDVDASGGNVDDGKSGTEGIKSSSQKFSLLQRYHRSLTDRTWSYALWAIEQAGPTYIKLVQWASTRNDLFSPEFVGHFSKLQDETRGHSWKDTEVALEKAFGKDWRGILSFDRVIEDEYEGGVDGGMRGVGSSANRERQERLGRRETLGKGGGNVGKGKKSGSRKEDLPTIPIGSGCVAQVYKARLRTSHGLHPAGTSVAVKVQHPHILEKVCLDFYIMNKFASILEYIPYLNLDYLSMKDSVDQFRDIMLPQLDLRVEAHNLKRFRRDFEGETQIAFPEPLVDLTSREVLVEKFVEGEPMLNFVKKEDEFHRRKDREELASIGLKTVMKMIFLNDFIHADLHPGNMIVDRNKSVRGQPLRIHMIDCGLTVELGERDHVNMVKILGSLIKRDGYAAGKLMVDTAKKCQATELDVELFCRGIDKIVEDDEDNNFLESVGDYITDICYLACKHKVKLEAAFINAALACEIMEGLAASLYPEMRVQQVALPLVLKAEMMHGLKGLPAAKLWMGS